MPEEDFQRQEREGAEQDPGSELLCPHCLQVVPEDATLCIHCKAPLSAIATLDPFQRIHAEGFIYREAAGAPRSLVTVVGIWVIQLPVIMLGFLAVCAVAMERSATWELWVTAGSMLLFGAAGLMLCVRCTWNYCHRPGFVREDEAAAGQG